MFGDADYGALAFVRICGCASRASGSHAIGPKPSDFRLPANDVQPSWPKAAVVS
jgi:hypothetical protein